MATGPASGRSSSTEKLRPKRGDTRNRGRKAAETPAAFSRCGSPSPTRSSVHSLTAAICSKTVLSRSQSANTFGKLGPLGKLCVPSSVTPTTTSRSESG